MTNRSSGNARFLVRGLTLLGMGVLVGCESVPSAGRSPAESNPADLTTRQSALTVGTWSKLVQPTPTTANISLQLQLLSDGSVLVGDGYTSWWKLAPDNTGSYQNGSWSPVASSHYARTFFPSTILQDGRYLLSGGEYVIGTSQANIDIYDPVADTWTEGPDMAEGISDTAASILPNGTFYVSNPYDTNTYFLNPTTLTWTQGPAIGTGSNGDEKGWTLLQDGSVLDAFFTGSYLQGGVWTATGAIPNSLVSASSIEIGPASLLYSGRVIQFGASDGPAAGNTAIYDPTTKTWAAGPSSPDGLLQWGDTSAVVMTNGHVLSSTTAGTQSNGTAQAIWEYDPTVAASTCAMTPLTCFTKVFPGSSSDQFGPAHLRFPIFLPLPNGQVLVADPNSGSSYDPVFHLYTPNGSPSASWRPSLTSISAPTSGVYTLTGKQLNGLTNGSSFGDDRNSASNYPIVGLKDTSGHVYYARSYAFNQMAPLVNTSESCSFVLPTKIPTGNYSVFVSASGVTSSNTLPLSVTASHVTSLSGPTNVAPISTGTMTATISTAAPAGGTKVTLASDNTAVATVPASVTVAQGHTTATFILTSHSYGFAHISGSVTSTQFQPATLEFGWSVNSVYDNRFSGSVCDMCQSGRNDANMPAGSNSEQWTVNISNAAPSSGVIVTLQSSDSRMGSVPASVTVPSGMTSAPFQVSRGSQPWGALVNITATVGAVSKTNSISTVNSAEFPQMVAPRSMLAM